MHLAAIVAVLIATLAPGGSFVDDDGNIHEGGIEAVAAERITLGCNPPANDRFCPEDPVTRGQMAAFLSRARNLTTATANAFTDDDGHVFEDAIDRIAAAGITVGCNPPTNDRFCPDDAVTRGQMAMMLARAFHLAPTAADRFTDDTGHVAEHAIDQIAAAGITRGCNPPSNDRFCPDDVVTRAQMATFLTRALHLTPLVPLPPTVELVSREGWGALAPARDRMVTHVIDRLTVHHTGNEEGLTGPAGIREMQQWHMTGQGWPDLAYHVVIGEDGTLYEGRNPAYRGDTGTSYDTTGHFLVVLEGNFEIEQPTQAQWDSLVAVLAWASEHYVVSPSSITGHADHAATLCPGRHLAARIHSGELEAAVRRAIDAGGVDLTWP